MNYDDNDGPVYSMLSGKVLSSAPCIFDEFNTGSCPGYCDNDPYWMGNGTESEVLAYCNEFAAAYSGGYCLGIVPNFSVEYPDKYLVFACRPSLRY